MQAVPRFLVHVIMPIAIGTCVYLGWRTQDLLAFRWIEYCGLSSFLVRPAIALPEWILYSLPDGCWVYATTSWMIMIWKHLTPWTWVAVVLAVVAEFGQLLGIVQGTYQTLDVLFYVAGFILAGVLNEKTRLVCDRNNRHGVLSVGQH